MGVLDGKVAFITGAARGQGRSHALRLAQEGADIIAVDLCDQIATVAYPMATPADLEQTVKEVEALDRRIVARQADVRDREGLTAAFQDGLAELGRLDIVLANAGIAPMALGQVDRRSSGTTSSTSTSPASGTRWRSPSRRSSTREPAGRSCSRARPPGSRGSRATTRAASGTPPPSTASSA